LVDREGICRGPCGAPPGSRPVPPPATGHAGRVPGASVPSARRKINHASLSNAKEDRPAAARSSRYSRRTAAWRVRVRWREGEIIRAARSQQRCMRRTRWNAMASMICCACQHPPRDHWQPRPRGVCQTSRQADRHHHARSAGAGRRLGEEAAVNLEFTARAGEPRTKSAGIRRPDLPTMTFQPAFVGNVGVGTLR
jgi:hypothetical protein